MVLKNLLAGFIVKIITGFDDTLTNIPVVASVAKTKTGKVAFGIGIFVGISLAVAAALFFSEYIRNLPFIRYISAVILFGLALAMHFDIFVHEPRKKAEAEVKKFYTLSAKHYIKLAIIGFTATLATVADDIIAYVALFVGSTNEILFTIFGILIGSILEIYIIIYLGHTLNKWKYKDDIAAGGLALLGVAILFGFL